MTRLKNRTNVFFLRNGVCAAALLAGLFLAAELKAQSTLIQRLNEGDPKQVIRAAQRLSAIGVNSPKAQEILADKLTSSNVAVRAACVDAIPYLGKPSPAVIKAMFESMALGGNLYPDTIPYVQLCADALEKVGPDGVGIAIGFLDTQSNLVYFGTTDYLHRMGVAAKPAVPELIERLKPGKRLWATVYALAGIGPHAEPAIGKLTELLDSDNFNTVCIACRALAGIGPAAASAKHKLLEVVKKGNVSERGRALQALAAIGVGTDEDVKPLLEENTRAFHQTIKERVVIGIGMLGREKGKSFVPLIEKVIQDPKFHNKPEAALTLYRIGGPLEKVVETLKESITDPTFELEVIRLSGELGKDGQPMLEFLSRYLDSDDDYLRAMAIESIGRIGLTETLKSRLKLISKTGEYLSARAARMALK